MTTKHLAVAFGVVALGAAGTAQATSDGTIRVRSGDSVVVNQNLRCLVLSSSRIVCGGAFKSRLNVEIDSNGQLTIIAEPTPHGAEPVMVIKRAVCDVPGRVCDLVIGGK